MSNNSNAHSLPPIYTLFFLIVLGACQMDEVTNSDGPPIKTHHLELIPAPPVATEPSPMPKPVAAKPEAEATPPTSAPQKLNPIDEKLTQCKKSFADCSCDEKGCTPLFEAKVESLTAAIRKEMMGVTWHKGCPVPLDNLRLLKILYWNESETVQRGEIVVAAHVAKDVVWVFSELYKARFPIHRMERAVKFGGNDDRSMRANNTSGMNCRKVKNTKVWSEHSFGEAIDINPIWNPWVVGNRVDPKQGRAFVNRNKRRPGMIVANDIVVKSFAKIGWKWGGTWRSAKDYQHFSRSGR